MPEEVTYATLRFPDPPKMKIFQESYSLKRTDNHESPEMETDGETEKQAGGVESRAELAENRAVAGHSVPSKVWCTVAFISLAMNLLLLAGLGILGLMDYQEFIFGNRTVDDIQQNTIQQLEENVTLCMNMYNNISNEHISFKNMIENTFQELNNFTSKYCEDLKQEENHVGFHSCLDGWHGDNRSKPHSQMDTDKANCHETQLHIRCLPSPVSGMDLNCPLEKMNQKAENVLKLCIWACSTPTKIPSDENSLKSEEFNGNEMVGKSSDSR